MKLVIPVRALRWLLERLQLVLFATAFALLAFVGFEVVDVWSFQRALLVEPAGEVPSVAAVPAVALPQGVIGQLDIARLGISAMLVEGTSRTSLRHAVGHVKGTPLPGEAGNSALSAHRDTFFRPLRNVRAHDRIRILRGGMELRYRVVTTQIVEPTDVSVLRDQGKEMLTLVTCYPFYFIGPAPQRFVVQAVREDPD